MPPTHPLPLHRTEPPPLTPRPQSTRAARPPPPPDLSDAPPGTYTWRLTTTTTAPKSLLHPTALETVSWERIPLRPPTHPARRPGPRPNTGTPISAAAEARDTARRLGPRSALADLSAATTGAGANALAAVRAVRGPDISTTSTTPATATATANPRAPPAKPARTLPGPETQPESRKPAAGKRKAGALVAEGEGEGRRKSARLMGRRG